MIVYFQQNDRIITKSKDRILQQIVYLQSKDLILLTKWSFTFSFRIVYFKFKDRVLSAAIIYFQFEDRILSAMIVYFTCDPNLVQIFTFGGYARIHDGMTHDIWPRRLKWSKHESDRGRFEIFLFFPVLSEMHSESEWPPSYPNWRGEM